METDSSRPLFINYFFQILRETAILGRATLPSRWNHLGLIAVEKHALKVALPLQNMSGLSLLSFNRAFDELEQMVNNDVCIMTTFNHDLSFNMTNLTD